jgi:DNA-binding MarR family transcriptional regulator/GNAT superfamily N-acetyltransferase
MSTTAVLRRFNRTYTQRIGVLEESFLGTGRPLAVSRLLFEIGTAEGITARDLRERLDLDSGHLSRMLRRLEAEGLVSTRPDPTDQRRRVVLLTDAGRAARRELDDRSEELASRIVAPLTDRQRKRLTEALATADLLVRAATVRLREVPPDDAGARHALGRYLAEIDERFPTGYRIEGPVATTAGPGSTYVLATSDGEPVAYGGIRPAPAVDERAVEIKRMWVHPDWRGAGLGSRMLRHLEALAVEHDAQRIVLDTNEVLAEAIAMYERSGYRQVERYPGSDPHATHFFEKVVTG